MAQRKPKAPKAPKQRAPASTTLDEVELQLVRIRAVIAADDAAPAKQKMTASVRAKMSAEMRGWLKLKNEIEHKAALLEDAVSHLPAWLELRDDIVKLVAECGHCGPGLHRILSD